MKKYARIYLILDILYFICEFVNTIRFEIRFDIAFNRPVSFSASDWLELIVFYIIPICSLTLALIHSFLLTWKSKLLLIISSLLYIAYLIIPEFVYIYSNYVTAPIIVIVLIFAGYIVCILQPKIPNRCWIAFLLMALLIACLSVTYWLDEQWMSLLTWGSICAAPLISFAMLGYILPETYD